MQWKLKNFLLVEHSVSELYTGLCVLENHSRVSISVLSRLSQLDKHVAFDVADLFCGMSLTTLPLRQTSEGAGIVLHDLLLDFCQSQPGKMMNSSLWHIRLLNGYLERQDESPPAAASMQEIHSILSRAPRHGGLYQFRTTFISMLTLPDTCLVRVTAKSWMLFCWTPDGPVCALKFIGTD